VRVIVFGAGLAGMNAWMALSRLPAIEVVAFLDNDRSKQGKSLCGLPIKGVEGIASVEHDAVLIASMKADEIRRQLVATGVPADRFIVLDPSRNLEAQLFDRGVSASARRPLPRSQGTRVAIFGAGIAGLRAWESLAPRCDVEVVAFLDNDYRRIAKTFLGVPVLSPENLDWSTVDLVAVASVYATDILRQLLAAGVPTERIVTVPLLKWLPRLGEAGAALRPRATPASEVECGL
jgi:FlaA1/EpsC-like NDP-sugar epimerase